MTPLVTRRWARFSADRTYRYLLGREFAALQGDLLNGWDSLPGRDRVLFVMLNPSLASERRDDPTLRRCIGLAHRWGFRALELVNLFALVTPDPRQLRATPDPVGPRNDACIRQRARAADRIVLAWGNHGAFGARADAVLAMLLRCGRPLFHLGLTREGHPRHPLYLPGDVEPMPWAPQIRCGQVAAETVVRQ